MNEKERKEKATELVCEQHPKAEAHDAEDRNPSQTYFHLTAGAPGLHFPIYFPLTLFSLVPLLPPLHSLRLLGKERKKPMTKRRQKEGEGKRKEKGRGGGEKSRRLEIRRRWGKATTKSRKGRRLPRRASKEAARKEKLPTVSLPPPCIAGISEASGTPALPAVRWRDEKRKRRELILGLIGSSRSTYFDKTQMVNTSI